MSRVIYQQHMLTRHQVTVYHCINCDNLISTRKIDLIKHMRSHYTGTSIPHPCRNCALTFPTKKKLATHRKESHPRSVPKNSHRVCHECGQLFMGSSGLRYHLRHVHQGVREVACRFCDKLFASRPVRDDHERTHTGVRPFQCPTCGKCFGSRAGLYVHKRSHTDEFPHACTVCPRTFRWLQQLIAHVRQHTGEKNYGCGTCGRAFRTQNDLTRHTQVHSTDKLFLCLVCGMTFAQKRYLRRHEMTRHKPDTTFSLFSHF